MSDYKDFTPGPFIMMQVETGARFWGCLDTTEDQQGWIPFEDERVFVYTSEEVAGADPGEDAIYVEVVDQSPDFLTPGNFEPNQILLHQDYERFAHRHNELFVDNGANVRLIGIHIDQHDFYYRLRGENGEYFASMALRLIPLRERIDKRYYDILDRGLCSHDADPCPVFMITREVRKAWPRAAAPAGYVHSFGPEDAVLFGPFTDEDEFKDFTDEARLLNGYGSEKSWNEDSSKTTAILAGTAITEEMRTKPSSYADDDDPFSAFTILAQI